MELLYLDNSYLKECSAKIIEVDEDKVVLDKTIFYPIGGGQPDDRGKIIGKEEYEVLEIRKKDGKVWHRVDRRGLEVGEEVKCLIDWERRYRLMRMHTAAHILASIFYNDYGAKITGNQLGLEKSRFDFNIENFDREKMEKAIEKANSIVERDIELKIYYLPREEAMKRKELIKLASVLPPSLKILRVVEIPGVDIQLDGGTHVKNVKEVGKLKLIKLENKGKNNRRVYFTLE